MSAETQPAAPAPVLKEGKEWSYQRLVDTLVLSFMCSLKLLRA